MRESARTILPSVVVPCYNVEAYVERAVVSSLNQTAPLAEVVCVDDGSTDGTLAVLRSLAAAHPDLVRVLTGPNGGACAARNRGLAAATGTYVQFLDADDELDAGKLRAQVEIAEQAGADLVAGAYRYRHPDGQVETQPAETGNPWVRLLQKRLGITSSNLWRRSAVEAVGGWDEGLESSQEADLMSRMLMAGAAVAFDPEPRTTVHGREGSISHEFSTPNRERYVCVRADALRYCQEHGLLHGDDLADAREAFFKSVRMLYPYDPESALGYYRRIFPNGYRPPVSASNTRTYVLAHRLLGFRLAEKARQWAGR